MKIISKAPARISLFGGGTDIDPYASLYGGVCVNMAINLRQKIVINSEMATLWADDNLRFFQKFANSLNLDMQSLRHKRRGEMNAGLGTSAACGVALVGGAAALHEWVFDLSDIAQKAWDIEVNQIGLYGGRQDQYCSAYGGVNVMEFRKDGSVNVTPLSRGFIEPVLPYLTLFHMGFNRSLSNIQDAFKSLTPKKKEALDKMKVSAVESVDAIGKQDIEKLAALLQRTWLLKKRSNNGVTNERIDGIYEEALKNGALAGKVLGAGGGGHILLLVEPKKRTRFIQDVAQMGLEYVDFSIDWNGLEVRRI